MTIFIFIVVKTSTENYYGSLDFRVVSHSWTANQM